MPRRRGSFSRPAPAAALLPPPAARAAQTQAQAQAQRSPPPAEGAPPAPAAGKARPSRAAAPVTACLLAVSLGVFAGGALLLAPARGRGGAGAQWRETAPAEPRLARRAAPSLRAASAAGADVDALTLKEEAVAEIAAYVAAGSADGGAQAVGLLPWRYRLHPRAWEREGGVGVAAAPPRALDGVQARRVAEMLYEARVALSADELGAPEVARAATSLLSGREARAVLRAGAIARWRMERLERGSGVAVLGSMEGQGGQDGTQALTLMPQPRPQPRQQRAGSTPLPWPATPAPSTPALPRLRYAPEMTPIISDEALDAVVGWANARCEAAAARTARRGEPRSAVFTTTAAGWAEVVTNVLPWVLYHAEVGVERFIVFYDGASGAPEAEAAKRVLRRLSSCVHLLDLSFEDRHGANAGRWVPMDSADSESVWARNSSLRSFANEGWSRKDEAGVVWERMGGRGPTYPPNSVNFTISMLARWMPEFGSKPGNYRLMILQSFNAEEAIHVARELGLDWILHIDVDEVFYPSWPGARGGMNQTAPPMTARELALLPHGRPPLTGVGAQAASEAAPLAADALPPPPGAPPGAAFALPSVLAGVLRVQPSAEKVEFFNNEAKVLRPEGYPRRFEQARVFARNGHFRPPCPGPTAIGTHCRCPPGVKGCGKGMVANANSFLVYTNGKAAARITDYVQQWGPHDFKARNRPIKSQTDEEGRSLAFDHEDAAVLHYPYMTLAEMRDKAMRSCPEFADAVRAGDVEAAGPCFVIEIDKRAFIAAVSGKEKRVRDHYQNKIVAHGNVTQQVAIGKWVILSEPAAIVSSSLTRALAAAGLVEGAEAADRLVTPLHALA